ncbi:hypothetical protein CgIS1_20065 [Frankia sp. CgS1]|uniref:Uncharacterized protein n=1 Tax=Frankia casuarinae (strain DSM 45818 / CECT 9043 / HFP020203 / CcI3) TaxID=106370 RepID=Q2JB81_FRACC|nr:hypothetical protein Francci3_2089 [Frankia casuarinae]OFB40248.1 hypothetical protein Manayef4_19270 [Frankia sp. CgIM4]OHV50646.1 hypothetical protein CgIS1_20065 [Frankia sp. CgIS1]
MIGLWWLKVAATMGSSSVVVPCVLGQGNAKVPLTEDQHPVGDLGPDRADEPFRVGVRPQGSGWDLDGGDAGVGERGAFILFISL